MITTFKLFENRNFKIAEENLDTMYQDLLNIMDDNDTVHQAKDLIFKIKKNNFHTDKLEYDFIMKTIEENGANEPFERQIEYQEEPNIIEETEYIYIPYWRKMIDGSKNIKTRNFVISMLNNIKKRKSISIKNRDGVNIEKFPTTDRELNILNLLETGNLKPSSFSTKN